MRVALPMLARLWATETEPHYVDAHEIARRIRHELPRAVVDWRRGDQWVENSLQSLIDKQTPDIILEGHRRLLGRTVHISLSYPEWPGCEVFTIASGIERELGDNLFLEIAGPFDLELLKRGAQDFSAALRFPLRLECNHDYRFMTITRPGKIDPAEFVLWNEADRQRTLAVRELSDWQATLRGAVRAWLSGYDEGKIAALTAGFPGRDEFVNAVVQELEAIGPVEQGWSVGIAEAPWRTCIVLDHGDWTTLVRVHGAQAV